LPIKAESRAISARTRWHHGRPEDRDKMKNAEALYLEHQLVSFIECGTLTIRNRAGKELVIKSTKFIPLGYVGHKGAGRVISDDAGEVRMGEDYYAIRVRARYWR
jgi:hypothetical protein